jgi:tRNA-binding EMAP/Myf-like protein
MDQTTFDQFAKIDIRSGTVIAAEIFPEARVPAYKLKMNFGGEIGVRKASTADRNAGDGCGEFPAAPNRSIHVRSSGLGISRR